MNSPSLKEITNSINMKFALIPKGTFVMGSPECEQDHRQYHETQHEVTLTRDFYLGVFPVTQAEYFRIMGVNPSSYQGGEPHHEDSWRDPVDQVNRWAAIEFCERLSDLPTENAAGRVYRLPTEAEWEYACRAGSTTAYCFGDDPNLLSEYAWYDYNHARTMPVGLKKPNAWGLSDMHGNVWEWCSDWYDRFWEGAEIDPAGPERGGYGDWGCWEGPQNGVLRGGKANSHAWLCRSAFRWESDPDTHYENFGFRVVLNTSQFQT